MSKSLSKKLENLSSPAFNEEDSPSVLKTGKRVVRNSSCDRLPHGIPSHTPSTTDRLRPNDHSASDLFGSSIFPNRISRKTPDLPKTPEKEPLKVSRLLKPRPKTPNFVPKAEHVAVKSLQISGLAANDDEISIKKLCEGMHVVELQANIDNVTGKCNGIAAVKVRANVKTAELDQFKLNMMEKGLEVRDLNENRGIRNSPFSAKRTFLDPHLQKEEKRLSGNFLNSDQRKKVNLATSEDLFGNSPGTGKYLATESSSNDLKDIKSTAESLRKWDSLKQIRNQNSKTPTKLQNAGYLKSTISSKNKGKV